MAIGGFRVGANLVEAPIQRSRFLVFQEDRVQGRTSKELIFFTTKTPRAPRKPGGINLFFKIIILLFLSSKP